jgi:hypothetical protein
MALRGRILADFGQLVIANEVFLVEMEQAAILAFHNLRRLLNI